MRFKQEPETSARRIMCSAIHEDWMLGIQLGKDNRKQLSRNTSLLEMRSHVFVQQSRLLINLNRSVEIAARTLPFLQNVNQDTKLFRVILS